MTSAETNLALTAIRNADRILIAIDKTGVHIRETLCVVHNHETKEVRYDALPIASISATSTVRAAIDELLTRAVAGNPEQANLILGEYSNDATLTLPTANVELNKLIWEQNDPDGQPFSERELRIMDVAIGAVKALQSQSADTK